MSEHYYTHNPVSPSDERRFTLNFAGQEYSFLYDNGVFSKGRLDEGTAILLGALGEVYGDVLDLGCGWGPVGTILGKRHPDANILMTDVNERALELSRKNLILNGVNNARVLCSDGFENISGLFDFIVTNPPIRAGKQTIYAMFDGALEHLKSGGTLTVVIRKQQGAESALKFLAKANAEVIERQKGYWVIQARI